MMTPDAQPPHSDRESHAGRSRRRETDLERLDRNLEAMTGELRVVVTGVQVLFAFLLIVPFNTGFAHVGDFERTVYFVTLVLAAEVLVDVRADAPHRLPVAISEEILRLGVLEKRVLALIEAFLHVRY